MPCSEKENIGITTKKSLSFCCDKHLVFSVQKKWLSPLPRGVQQLNIRSVFCKSRWQFANWNSWMKRLTPAKAARQRRRRGCSNSANTRSLPRLGQWAGSHHYTRLINCLLTLLSTVSVSHFTFAEVQIAVQPKINLYLSKRSYRYRLKKQTPAQLETC